MAPKPTVTVTTQLTQQLRQALEILQLTTIELSTRVQNELDENPMLVEDDSQDSDGIPKESEAEAAAEPLGLVEKTSEIKADENGLGPEGIDKDDWDSFFPDDDYIIPKFDREQYADYKDPQIAEQQTLDESLLWQLRMADVSEEDYRIGELIIGNLDEQGFFNTPLEEIAASVHQEITVVANVLAIIQTLEPVGIAARDVVQCLTIQLQHLSQPHPLAERIVSEHLTALEKHQLEKIAKDLRVTREEVVRAAKVIASLDPYPGRHVATGTVHYVVPDVVLEKHDDQYIIIVNDDRIPALGINRRYAKLLKRKGSELSTQEKQFLRQQRDRAKLLIESIDKRRKTYYRVVEAILDVQKDFFEKGIEFLKPLVLKEIADKLGLHESTISRVTSGKYMQSPKGMFELKYFFSSQIHTENGESISSTSVKAALREMIDEESTIKPYSDQKLTRLLNEKGLKIARRTVAKYREELNLPPASGRKKLE